MKMKERPVCHTCVSFSRNTSCPVCDVDAKEPLADRMKAAGMMSVEDMVKGHPFDIFHAHAGVTNLAKFEEWLEMKRAEYLKMHARFDLEKRDSTDELYEWVLAHSAVFNVVHINFRNAMKGEKDVQ